MYNPTFIGDIDLNDDALAHFGVKGMKWRRRKGTKKNTKKMSKEQKERYYARKMADDVVDGRRKNYEGLPGASDSRDIHSPMTDNSPGRDFVNKSRVQTYSRYEDPYQTKLSKFVEGQRYVHNTYETSREEFDKALEERKRRKK